ncbi:MAG: tRNA (adenosine(37)-N6)-dimethylallyltransferase MiaA [Planctomycetota bacterium]|nr:tRNA (adenosine(37)-N6)-dimethylallyltransferase MiaA [Planctomycetota bacterium]
MTEPSIERPCPPLPPVPADCWFLTGPTASGKTAVAIALAQQMDAEIISLDSMAIYRGMDIGTAKPTEAQQILPHHLLDIRDPVEEFSVAQYLELAHQHVAAIEQRGKAVLFVGGTPMYLKVLLRGMFTGPPADWEFREQIEQQLDIHGNLAIHQQLERVDPLSAHKLHPNDVRRVIRALEVFHLTGEPISHQQHQFEEQGGSGVENVFVLSWPRPQLHQRIERRVEQMFEDGFVQEVVNLQEKYKQLGRTAAQAVGYCEVLEYLSDECTLAEAVEQVKVRTRRFARRQETWLRGFSECKWIAMTEPVREADVVNRILEQACRSL